MSNPDGLTTSGFFLLKMFLIFNYLLTFAAR